MLNRTKIFLVISFSWLLLATTGCKKGTFDINSPNPNTPSTVPPKFALSGALAATANLAFSGNQAFINRMMGYWAFSGDYGGYGSEAAYNLTTGFNTPNWDVAYSTCLVNYRFIESASTAPNSANYLGIAKIMECYHFHKLVDIYNNIPYTSALNGGLQNYPKYDDAKSVYLNLVKQLDSAVLIIKNAPSIADNPGNYDILFGGKMANWIKFANTIRLRILLNLTQTSDGPALITSELNGLGAGDFLGAGVDAAVNPGYSNGSQANQNPLWQYVGFTTGGSNYGNRDFNRANSYAVNFYLNTNDTRGGQLYDVNSAGVIRGRAYGSTDGSEHNTLISATGHGVLQSASAPAAILPAFESLFMQAEAAQRGYISGDPKIYYQTAIEESYRILFNGGAGYLAAADAYFAQTDTRVNWNSATNKINLILLQEWAALNTYDPFQAWNNWRRLGIPSDLPVSVYPGASAPHIPIRLLYPTSEYSTNTANVNAQGTIDPINSKIFWMP